MDQETDIDELNENLHVVCRLCSAKENLISLFKGKNKTNRDYIRKLVSITVGVKYHHDDYLDLICLSCVLQVYNMYVFCSMSRENEQNLQTLVQEYPTTKRHAKELPEIELPDFTELKNLMTIWIFAKQGNYNETNKSAEYLDKEFTDPKPLTPPSTIFENEIIPNIRPETCNIEIQTTLKPDVCDSETQTEAFTGKEASIQCELLKPKMCESPKPSRKNKNMYIQCELLKTENCIRNRILSKNVLTQCDLVEPKAPNPGKLLDSHTQTTLPFEHCDAFLSKSGKCEILGCVHQKMNSMVKVNDKKDDNLTKNNIFIQNMDEKIKCHQIDKAALGLEFFLKNKNRIEQKNESLKRDSTESKFKNKKFKSNNTLLLESQKISEDGELESENVAKKEKKESDSILKSHISKPKKKKRDREVKEKETSTSDKKRHHGPKSVVERIASKNREKHSSSHSKASETNKPLNVKDKSSANGCQVNGYRLTDKLKSLFDNEQKSTKHKIMSNTAVEPSLSSTHSNPIENNDSLHSPNSSKLKFLECLDIRSSCGTDAKNTGADEAKNTGADDAKSKGGDDDKNTGGEDVKSTGSDEAKNTGGDAKNTDGDDAKNALKAHVTESPHKDSFKPDQNICDQNYINNSQKADLLANVKLEQEFPVCPISLHACLVVTSTPSLHDSGSPSVETFSPHSSELLKVSRKVDFLKHCSECRTIIHTEEEMSVHRKIHRTCCLCRKKFRSIKKTKEHMASACIEKICLKKVAISLVKLEKCKELFDKYPHCLNGLTPIKSKKRPRSHCGDQGISESVKKKLILSESLNKNNSIL